MTLARVALGIGEAPVYEDMVLALITDTVAMLASGEEAASDQTTDAVASKHELKAAAASSLAAVPNNDNADAHPDELSLALDLQSLQVKTQCSMLSCHTQP